MRRPRLSGAPQPPFGLTYKYATSLSLLMSAAPITTTSPSVAIEEKKFLSPSVVTNKASYVVADFQPVFGLTYTNAWSRSAHTAVSPLIAPIGPQACSLAVSVADFQPRVGRTKI